MVVTLDGQPMNPRGKVSLTVINKNRGGCLGLEDFWTGFHNGKNLFKLF